ncbi:MAG: ATP-binding protein [Oscillospiraceae bacterium]|nr:ATP-binding protein [Oscillospiraceae bacterium]
MKLEEQRRAEISEKLPQYEELEKSLSATMSDAVNAVLNKSPEDKVEEIYKKNYTIRKQMDELLESTGYPADYLDSIYTCKLCKDTGNTGNEWCECLCRLTNELAAAELNANTPLDRCNFVNFDTACYPDVSDGELENPREMMQSNFEFCKKFAENFSGKGSGILMIGETGLGKTHLSLSIANVLIEKGFCVAYGSVPELVRRIQNEQFGRAEGDTLSLATDSDLLILDDLGSENSTDYCVSMLYEIINTRQNRRLPFIINTNLDFNEIKIRYQDRLYSRMASIKILFFSGNDNRVEFSENFEG